MTQGGFSAHRRGAFAMLANSVCVAAMTLVSCCLATRVQAEVKVSDFGKTADGTAVKAFTITNAKGDDRQADLARRDARRMARAR